MLGFIGPWRAIMGGVADTWPHRDAVHAEAVDHASKQLCQLRDVCSCIACFWISRLLHIPERGGGIDKHKNKPCVTKRRSSCGRLLAAAGARHRAALGLKRTRVTVKCSASANYPRRHDASAAQHDAGLMTCPGAALEG